MKDIFLVDADDTVLDFHGASYMALRAAFEGSGVPFEEKLYKDFERMNAKLWEALERKELTRKELMSRRFHIYLRKIGFERLDGDRFNQLFLSHLANNPFYITGAEDFLKVLRGLGRVYIVTNGTAWIQKSRFEISKLPSYAEDVFVSDTIGFDKPAKEYTDYVISHIPQFSAERAVWIGDSASADIKAANEANITSIWFNRQGKVAPEGIKPDYTAKNFIEILDLLQKIN